MRKSLQSFKRLIAEYGVVALVVHYVIFAAVIVSAYVAINAGWQPAGRMAGAGTWAAAYVVAKITQPVRLVITIALVPLVARLYTRLTGRDVASSSCPVALGARASGGTAVDAARVTAPPAEGAQLASTPRPGIGSR